MSLNIAIIGYESGFGEELLNGLEDSGINVNQLYLIGDSSDEDEVSVRFHQKTIYVQPTDSFNWKQAHTVVLMENQSIEIPVDFEGHIIDLRSSEKNTDWQLISTSGQLESKHVCIVDDLTNLLSKLIQPFLNETVIDALNTVALVPVTYQNSKGSEFLAREIGQLMNGRPLETHAFGTQQAFNLIPKKDETVIFDELNQLFPKETLSGAVTYIQSPVFFGSMLTVDLHFEDELEPEEIKSYLSQIEGIELTDEILTPVTHGSDKTVTFMSYFIEDKRSVNQVRLLLISDLRKNGRVQTAIHLLQQIEANQTGLTH